MLTQKSNRPCRALIGGAGVWPSCPLTAVRVCLVYSQSAVGKNTFTKFRDEATDSRREQSPPDQSRQLRVRCVKTDCWNFEAKNTALRRPIDDWEHADEYQSNRSKTTVASSGVETYRATEAGRAVAELSSSVAGIAASWSQATTDLASNCACAWFGQSLPSPNS